jgi:DNA polymerase
MDTLFEKAERYLRQHQSVFGERLFVEQFLVQQDIRPIEDVRTAVQHKNAQSGETGEIKPDKMKLDTMRPEEAKPDEGEQEEVMPTTFTMPISDDWREATSLQVLNERICECLNCKLGATRTKFVFGVGNPNADVLVIGEAPGADEDAQGEPFVGRAGQLLNKILEAIDFKREDVYIANIIKCRPPENRRPEPDEVEQCEPYLHKQIECIQPRLILALGLTAVNTLLKGNFKMGDIRGKQLNFRGVPMIATYHPAALLRNPEWKKVAWEDVKLLRRLYDEGVQPVLSHDAIPRHESPPTSNEAQTGLFG